MSEIVVVALIKAKQGHGAEAEALFRTAIAPSHAEQGCLLYALHRVAKDADRLVMIERWESRERLDAHLTTPHIKTLFQAGELVLDGPVEVMVLDPAAGGDPAKGTLAGA